MKVLMITPGVDENHDILGFTASWIRALSKRVERLHVITLDVNRETPLPENTIVYGLNERVNKLTKYLYFSRVMIGLLSRKQVDVIFCHTSSTFVLMAAPWAKLFWIPIVTWYTHGTVNRRLRIAHFLTNKVVTASKESYSITDSKVIITGHGIDTDMFRPSINPGKSRDKKAILSLGRISPIKDYETLIEAANILINEKGIVNLEFIIVGGVGLPSQKEYYQQIRKRVEELELRDHIKFAGSVPHHQVIDYYSGCDLFVNMCPTGGMDKAVLEAMACAKPVIVANETFKPLLYPYDNLCLFRHHDAKGMAVALANLINSPQKWRQIGEHNRGQIIQNHSVSHLADRLVNIFAELLKRKEN